MRRVVPMAARALGPRFTAVFERYAAGSAPRGSKAELDDAVGFVKELRRRADLVERFELGPLLAQPVNRMSLGQRMRCEIVASLLLKKPSHLGGGGAH